MKKQVGKVAFGGGGNLIVADGENVRRVLHLFSWRLQCRGRAARKLPQPCKTHKHTRVAWAHQSKGLSVRAQPLLNWRSRPPGWLAGGSARLDKIA